MPNRVIFVSLKGGEFNVKCILDSATAYFLRARTPPGPCSSFDHTCVRFIFDSSGGGTVEIYMMIRYSEG